MTEVGADAARGVYGISVAAELVGMGVQNLRAYEARGLLEPGRTQGGTRRYSANDLARLRRISELLEAGLNIAGIAMVLQLQDENTQLREMRAMPTAEHPSAALRRIQTGSTTPRSYPEGAPRRQRPSPRAPSTRHIPPFPGVAPAEPHSGGIPQASPNMGETP